MIEAAEGLAEQVGVSAACQALGVPRSSFYRMRASREKQAEPAPRPKPPRALSDEEKQQVRNVLNSKRFQDQSPRQVWATLLDEGRYLCNWRTMYRVLEEHAEVRERRNQLQRPVYEKPELLARAPNELWSWDITKLKGPVKWTYFYLYVILDVFSRYVVGWMVAERESSALAKELIEQTCQRQGIDQDQLVLHADRGASMTSKSVAQLLADLGITKTHSRPHVSNDNPYSEAQFKTMKYREDFPVRFGSIADARVWARAFFPWYNNDHYHSGIGLMTPAQVHYGQADEVQTRRQQVLDVAYAAHPERFVRGPASVPGLPEAVWINAPKQEQEQENTKEQIVVVVEAVDPVVRPQRSAGLSTSPQLVMPAHDPVMLH
jgi:putative transposase